MGGGTAGNRRWLLVFGGALVLVVAGALLIGLTFGDPPPTDGEPEPAAASHVADLGVAVGA